MKIFENLGLFYLGKHVDARNDLLLYESKDLTTHAVCVGMTGSGKTGLGIALLEEAAIDQIPAIIIDPKGDLGNLLLTFPNLSPEDFQPWVDAQSAQKERRTSQEYAKKLADSWRKGLAGWGEDAERIQLFRDSVDLAIYTPANHAGIPLSVLSSFKAPSEDLMRDKTVVRDKILALTTSLLGLIDIKADPFNSREATLISLIIQSAWEKREDVDIASLIQKIQKPDFTKVGALDLETFYPQKERSALAIRLNNLLASPGFQAWMEGEPLDISRLLYTDQGKPKLSIISINHLSDSERMFFVTLLLNEMILWMREQPGTSSLRALLYMDEIFGFFPPTANPPSKLPMLTLLKTARAYGVGIVLATQNPVDLDYKGLSNCGTWFIGKLQTARDKLRLIEGLKSAHIAEEGQDLDQMFSSLERRKFLMRSVHQKELVLFETRWTLSYLYGPLTLKQISSLTKKPKNLPESSILEENSHASPSKPLVPPGIPEFFAHPINSQQPLHYKPSLIGIAKLHYVSAKNNLDVWNDVCMVLYVHEGDMIEWDKGENLPQLKPLLQKEPIPGSTFEELPSILSQEKKFLQFAKQFASSLYQNHVLTLYQTPNPKLTSKEGESEKDFRIRASLELREERDKTLKKVRDKYTTKIQAIHEKIRRAQEKMASRQQKANMQKTDTLISAGSTILGTLFGRKMTKGTVSQTGTTLRKAARIRKDAHEVARAQEEIDRYTKDLQDLETQLNQEISVVQDTSNIPITTLSIPPRKGDISVESVAILWIYQS